MSELIIFDTSVLVDEIRTGNHRERIASVKGVVRISSVVLVELSRGAVVHADRRFVEALARHRPILTPTEKNWIESGQVLAEIRSHLGFAPAKLRDLHFDVLIALTARSHGARLITSNRSGFELIQRYRRFESEIW
jgi:predicted nucleic acid-binding protein